MCTEMSLKSRGECNQGQETNREPGSPEGPTSHKRKLDGRSSLAFTYDYGWKPSVLGSEKHLESFRAH